MKRLGDYFNLGWDENLAEFKKLTEKQWNILEAALEVFTEKGYTAATTSEISKRAGVAEGTIFRHFKQKKDILLALLIPLLENLVGPNAANSLNQVIIVNQDKPLKEILVLILEERYRLFMDNQKLLRLVLTEAQYHPELREALKQGVIYKSQETLVGFLASKQRQGEIRMDIDIWTIVRSLFGMLSLFVISQQAFPEKEGERSVKKEIETMVELFLNGASE